MRPFLLSLFLSCSLSAQDTSLHEFVIDDQPWREAAGGYDFTDGLCTDTAGNVFFTDVKSGKGIYKIDVTTGKADLFLDNLPGISGLQIGPDGRFYACQNKAQRIVAITMQGQVEELLANVKCNDLVVSKAGHLYFTETPTKRIHLITAAKKHLIADEGHVTRPNGITLSSDEQALYVSDHGGKHVWAWKIAADGTLSAAAPYMTMWLPTGKEEAFGDGATTESKGRIFVTTELGVQIFDPAGRLSGILAKPEPQRKVVSVEFGGKDHDILYVAAGDKIFARKLKVAGYFR
ncbi:MAG: SMP-30/gluconolactonase/LRE family protein [Verrucomicrobiaceae bacterium]|nr:SMP-30/gluconolactonase/LRE family protein [Verrucomicrobiaceae bacterium]